MVALAIEHLTITYPEAEHAILRDVSFTLNEGDFAILCGETGCGKTTLLQAIRPELLPCCTKSGGISYAGKDIAAYSPKALSAQIGFVQQHPEQQIVTDRVWHELAFGLENLGIPQDVMRRKIAETASYFGIEAWLDKDPAFLSGGQKQLLNLAAVMVMQPRLLLLDEPTAQLDPIAASNFLSTIRRLNQDFSVTILLVEHRLEEVIPMANRLLLLEEGKLRCDGTPADMLSTLPADHPALLGMPAAVRIYHGVGASGICPLSVRDARCQLMPQYRHNITMLPAKPNPPVTSPALICKHLFFRYNRKEPDILNDLSLTIHTSECFCLIGGNGAGKSTLLSAIAGLCRPYAGKLTIFGKEITKYKGQSLYQQCVALLPQDVQTVFLKDTVEEEFAEVNCDFQTDLRDFPFDLTPFMKQHPYDLSGGQQQIVALAKVMCTKPRLLLLDEPTKGLDAAAKEQLASILHALTKQGVTVLMVTHDVEFTACHGDRCGFLSRGQCVSVDIPSRFFSENAYFTTAASRISRGFYKNAVTVADVVALCIQNGREDGGTV